MSFLLRNAPQVLLLTGQNLKRFRDLVNHSFHESGYDITYDQWTVLAAVAQKQGISQVVIANITDKEPASISRILKIVEKKELIQKLNDEKNKKAKRIYLTPSGDEIEKKATVMFNKIAQQGFDGIYEQEINLFVRVLDKLKGNFEAMDIKKSP